MHAWRTTMLRATIDSAALSTAISFAAKGAPRQSTIPVLEHGRIALDQGGRVVTGPDLDLMHRARAAIIDGEAGAVVVPAARTGKLVAAIPADTRVAVRDNGDHVSISAGRGR